MTGDTGTMSDDVAIGRRLDELTVTFERVDAQLSDMCEQVIQLGESWGSAPAR